MNKRMNFIIFIIVLFMFFASSTYAFFKTGFGGHSSMTAATWSVTLNQPSGGDHLSIMPSPNEMVASYTVNITNVSEVTVAYSIVIDNIPTGVSISLDGGEFEPESNHKVIFNNFNPIFYNATNKNRSHVLTFKATSGVTYVSNSEINIDVIAKQQI